MFIDSAIVIRDQIHHLLDYQKNAFNRFYKKMIFKSEEEISLTIEEGWESILDDSSYHNFRQYIRQFTNTDDDDIDNNMRLKAHYWSQNHKCQCDSSNRSPCGHTCHDSKIWFSVELDPIFGIELYRYDLNIGGPKHGTFVINSGHYLNDNEEDIVINILEHHENFHFIDNLKKSIQGQYDQLEEHEKYISECKTNLHNNIIRYKLQKMIKMFDDLQLLYPDIVGYNFKSKKLYDVIIKKSSGLINEANGLIKSNTTKNPDIATLCLALNKSLFSLNNKIDTWMNIINTTTESIFCPDIQKHICDFI